MSPLRDDGDESLDDLLTPLDGEAGPARRISRRKSAGLVMAALEAGARETPSRLPARRKRPPVWLIAGALLFTGAAAAAVWRLTRFEPTSAPKVTRTRSEPSRPASAGVPTPTVVSGQTSAQISNAPAPEDLLLMANELRARGRWKEAEELYQRVIQTEAAARPRERSTPPLREAGP